MNDVKTWHGFFASGGFFGLGKWLQMIDVDVWLPRISFLIAIIVGILSIIQFFERRAFRKRRETAEFDDKLRGLHKSHRPILRDKDSSTNGYGIK